VAAEGRSMRLWPFRRKRRAQSERMGLRHIATLRSVAAFIKEFGYPPTVEDVRIWRGYESRSTPWFHLKVLRAAGLVTWTPHTARTLRITDKGKAILQK